MDRVTSHRETRRGIMRAYGLAALVLAPVYALFFVGFRAWWSALGAVISGALAVLAFVLGRNPRVKVEREVMVSSLWLGAVLTTLTTGGLSSPILLWLALSPFVAGAILGRRAALLLGVASVAFAALVFGFAEHGLLDEVATPFGRRLLSGLATTSGAALLGYFGWVTSKGYEDSQARLAIQNVAVQATADSLSKETRALKAVLDNVEQGLCLVGMDGKIATGYSAAFSRWFGAPDPGITLWEFARPWNPKLAIVLESAWGDLAAGYMPPWVVLSQCPSQLVRRGRTYSMRFRPIGDREAPSSILLVIADVTETVDAERRLESKHDLLALFEHFTSDPTAFRRAMVELDHLVRAALVPPKAGSRGTAYAHRLHTLKGCASMYGLACLVNRTHVIEDEWGQMGEVKAASLEDLRRIWDDVELRVRAWMQTERTLVVTEPELRRIELSVREGATPVALAMLERLAWERVDRRLAEQSVRLADLAAQLGKLEPEVVVDARDVRVPPDFCAELWSSLVHVLKNAVDHGIEDSATRVSLGKPERGTVLLAAKADDRVLELEVRDDGRGIDWANVREKARARGLPTSRRSDLVDALFSEGLSTREEVTQVSGRGLGTAAVRHIVEKQGGRVLVESELGKWTSFRFVLPLPGTSDLPARDESNDADDTLELLTG